MHAKHLRTQDFVSLPKAISGGPSTPARVSFNVAWKGGGDPVPFRSDTDGFRGAYIEDTATIRWSAHGDGFRFQSDPDTTSEFAEIGTERNGVFF